MMFKEYTVTITPKITAYAGASVFGEYTVTVFAKSHAEALKQARAERRESEGHRNHHRILCRQGLGSDFHRIAD